MIFKKLLTEKEKSEIYLEKNYRNLPSHNIFLTIQDKFWDQKFLEPYNSIQIINSIKINYKFN